MVALNHLQSCGKFQLLPIEFSQPKNNYPITKKVTALIRSRGV